MTSDNSQQLQLLFKLLQNLDNEEDIHRAPSAQDVAPEGLSQQVWDSQELKASKPTEKADGGSSENETESSPWKSPERAQRSPIEDPTPQKVGLPTEMFGGEFGTAEQNDALNNAALSLLKTFMADNTTTRETAATGTPSSEAAPGIADMTMLSTLLRTLQTNLDAEPSAEASSPAARRNNEEDWEENAGGAMIFFSDGSLNLDLFKVYLCKNESHIHDRKNCPFYHTHRDRRRLPVTYRAEQCDDSFDLEEDFQCSCPRGEQCDKCHNRHELLYHPGIYKQRFCSSYNHVLQRSVQCHRGRFCAFAHSRPEIRCQLFSEDSEKGPDSQFFMMHFKTLWCPYGIQHDWHGCLYAHTYQDCRRSPLIGYGSEPCPYWQKDLHSADYKRRCPRGTRCPYSHGSKEQLYHPAYYKTMPCADFKIQRSCPRGHLCAFYHDSSERRPAGNSCFSAEDGGPPVAYDYGLPLPKELMSCLQQNFMNPPLFNLDDFEAFGHGSRMDNRRSGGESNNFRNPGRQLFPSERQHQWMGESPKQMMMQQQRRCPLNRNMEAAENFYFSFKGGGRYSEGRYPEGSPVAGRGGAYTSRHLRASDTVDVPLERGSTSTASLNSAFYDGPGSSSMRASHHFPLEHPFSPGGLAADYRRSNFSPFKF